MTKHIANNTALVTVGQVNQKLAERAAKAARRDDLNREIEDLDKWLEAAALLSGRRDVLEFTGHEVETDELFDNAVEEENMADATKRILAAAGRSITNKQLQDELRKTPLFAERLDKNPNYYYTMVSRLIKRGEIQRFRKLLRMPKTETAEPQVGSAV